MYIHVHGDEPMATKTISIDVEAYERLRSVRQDKESFSQTIKRVVKPPFDFEAFRKQLEGLSLSEKAASAIEEQIQNRHRPSNRD
jgi:predicted CopG family antitoxin